jgi:hypothetical protein
MKIPASCQGVRCGICFSEALANRELILGHAVPSEEYDKIYIMQAFHKVGEEIFDDDHNPVRHNLTQYVCCNHFQMIMSQKDCSH